MQDMGFETTLISPPPPSATFKAKIPMISLTKGNTMEVDDEYGVKDFTAEMAAISDHDLEDECEFQKTSMHC